MLARGCEAAPKTIAEFVLKDRSRFVGGVSRPSASKLARHGPLTRFKRFLTEQHWAPAPDCFHHRLFGDRIARTRIGRREQAPSQQRPAPAPNAVQLRIGLLNTSPVASELARAGLQSSPKTIVELALKDRSRFVRGASRPSANLLARHEPLTRFKRFLTEQHWAPAPDCFHHRLFGDRIARTRIGRREQAPSQQTPAPVPNAVQLRIGLLNTSPVASELARVGLQSSPKNCRRVRSERPQSLCWVRFAHQREQARSPRVSHPLQAFRN